MKNTYKKQRGAGLLDVFTSKGEGNGEGNGEEKGFLQTVESTGKDFTNKTKEAVGMKKSGQTDMGHLKSQISDLEQAKTKLTKDGEEQLRALKDKTAAALDNDTKKIEADNAVKLKKFDDEIAELKKKQSDLIEESKKILAEAQYTTTTPAPPLATSGGGRKRRTRSRKVKKHKTRKSNKSNKKRKFRKTRKH